MASMNTSSAYDLSAYEVQPKQKKPALRAVKPSRRASTVALTPEVFASFFIVVTLCSVMVYNQVCLNEVSGQIHTLNTQLSELESENIKLNSELESIMNLDAIEEQAKSVLGMHRLDLRQIETINLRKEDEIRLTEDSPSASLGEKIESAFQSAIGTIQEYLGEQ